MKLASRMDRIGTETAFEVGGAGARAGGEGQDIIHLEIGEPDFDTPQHISEAAARRRSTTATPTTARRVGLPELREAIAADVAQHAGIEVDPGAGRRHARRPSRSCSTRCSR